MSNGLRIAWLMLLLLGLIIIPFLLWGAWFEAVASGLLSRTDGPAIASALVILLLTSDIILPLPSSLVTAAGAAVLGPLLGTLVIWIGLTCGHLIGYWAGRFYGQPAVTRIAGEDARRWLSRQAAGMRLPVLIVMTRAVPVLSEAVTVSSGAASMRLRDFLWPCALANLGVSLVYGLLGSAVGHSEHGFVLVFAVSLGVPVVGWMLLRLVAFFRD